MYCYFSFKYGNCDLVFIAAYTGLLNESNRLVCKCLNSEGKKTPNMQALPFLQKRGGMQINKSHSVVELQIHLES